VRLQELLAEESARIELTGEQSEDLRRQLSDAQAAYQAGIALVEDLERQLEEERARVAEAAARAEEQGTRAEQAEGELTNVRERLTAAEGRVAELERESAEALEAAATAGAEALRLQELLAAENAQGELTAEQSEDLRRQLSEAQAAHQAGTALIEETQRQLEEVRARVAEAAARAEEQGTRAEQAEHQLAEARAQLAAVETTTMALATSEQALRQQLDGLPRTDLGEGKPKHRGRSKVSARAYRETLTSLEQEKAERARLEQESVRLVERVTELEQELATRTEAAARAEAEAEAKAEPPVTPAQATVEADLRHLLTVAQRDLDEARAALSEQQARYAAVASEVVSDDPAGTESDAVKAEDEKPWSAVDDDLLSRINRANEFVKRH
jgi:chromosome segregation ATPase